MRLLSLTANQDTFHSIYFSKGINIIVGKQAKPHNENDGNTYNGVGKSLILHLIHFCLGSRKITSLAKGIPGWEFTLRFEVDGKEYYCSRNVDNQNKINFSGDTLNPKELQNRLLELCFGLKETPKDMTWTTLFSRFARRYRTCYTTFDSFTVKETDYSKILNNCFLLGIDTELIVAKRNLRDEEVATATMEKTLKNDPLFRQYYLGESDAELDVADLEYRIHELEKELSQFKVSNSYHELEIEADEKSYEKKMLENKRVLVSNYIKNIENSTKETEDISEETLLEIYQAAQIEIPNMVKKSLDEVTEFHNELLSTRNVRLKKELQRHQAELKKIDKEISDIGSRMDELLNYLDSHGALEEYVALTKQLSALKSELNRIQEYQKILKAYRDTNLNIKAALIEQDKAADIYLEENNYFEGLRNKFWNYAKCFYPKKKSGLVVKNNFGENMLRYRLEARIEDDSSDGVNEVRMFCFDWLILNCMKSKLRFIAHDSRMFANMDPRQRETLFRIVYETCLDTEFQYICSINQDALESFRDIMQEEEYAKIIEENIVLELNDDAPQSKLLGIQVDIDLEDKGKGAGEIK